MAYENPPFRRRDAGGRRSEPAVPHNAGDRSMFQAGQREGPDLRSGAAFRNANHPDPNYYQDSSEYQAGFDYQGTHYGVPDPAGAEPDRGYPPAGGYPAGGHADAGYASGGYGPDGRFGAAEPPTQAPVEVESEGDVPTRPVPAAKPEEPAPEPSKPARDRFAVHWLWEALLLIGVGALTFLVWQADSSALRGEQLSLLLLTVTGFGLLGLAAGISLRAAVPNLAIGPVAVAAGVYFAQNGGDGVVVATGTAAVAAVLLAVAVAVSIVLFHVPGWAASLAAAVAAVVWLRLQPAQIELTGGFNPRDQAAFLFAAVAAIGTIGGLLGTMPGIRDAVGRMRPVADPARRRGVVAAVMTGLALVGSMVLAVPAGVLLVAGFQEPIGPGAAVEGSSGVTWLTWTVIGFAVALIGGTSAFGRRGGVFGTILATVALVLFYRYQATQEWQIALLAIAGGGLAGGLMITRLVETFGKPKSVSEPAEPAESRASATPAADRPVVTSPPWETAMPTRVAEPSGGRHSEPTLAANQDWPNTNSDSWSSVLPARPAPGGNRDPWDDDRWGHR